MYSLKERAMKKTLAVLCVLVYLNMLYHGIFANRRDIVPSSQRGIRKESFGRIFQRLRRIGPVGPVIAGGWSDPVPAGIETQQVIDAVKQQVGKILRKQLVVYKAVLVRKQVVAGTNYLIKVYIGDGSWIHLRVFLALPANGGKCILRRIQTRKTAYDPLVYF